ncbi:hypothetical protein CTAYLR_003855 [Chrysophaeum taylorii]|uniref:Protein SirB1 N-terminal domain-containing protein n=1 Tax=Chrysophaeum taylorii TaxID=2483200 RepID=A0AAD7UKD4_9STRA|nr:hypothetical protein CTAYLR_003855 [Chrysophaeum taylorii]
MLEVTLQKAVDIGGARVRCVASGTCRDWRRQVGSEVAWRREYERRWWHRVEVEGWCAAYGSRMRAEQRVLEVLGSIAESPVIADPDGDPVARRQAAASLESVVAYSAEDVREILVVAGAAAASNFCLGQLVGTSRFRKPPVRSLSELRRFVSEASPDAARKLTRPIDARVVAAYVDAALATAMRAHAATVWTSSAASLEDGLLAVGAGLRVFFDTAGVLAELSRLGAIARASKIDDDDGVLGAVERVFVDEGFEGNTKDYYALANSLLDRVLDRRLGIPVSLAAVFVAVAERAGLDKGRLRPVNAPGHFLLEYDDEVFVDVFPPPDGYRRVQRLSRADVLAFVGHHNGLAPAAMAQVAPIVFRRPDNPDVWRRVLRNLFHVCERRNDAHTLYVALSLHAELDRSHGAQVDPHILTSRARAAHALRIHETILLPATIAADVRAMGAASSSSY